MDKCGNAVAKHSLVSQGHGIEKQRMAEAEHSLTIQSKGRVEFSKGIVKLRIAKAELCVAETRYARAKQCIECGGVVKLCRALAMKCHGRLCKGYGWYSEAMAKLSSEQQRL